APISIRSPPSIPVVEATVMIELDPVTASASSVGGAATSPPSTPAVVVTPGQTRTKNGSIVPTIELSGHLAPRSSAIVQRGVARLWRGRRWGGSIWNSFNCGLELPSASGFKVIEVVPSG